MEYDNGQPSGFIKDHAKPRVQKMRWDAAADRKLLLLGLGREISAKEYAAIAGSFKENPTPKSIQERLQKLRREQNQVLAELEIGAAKTVIHDVLEDDLAVVSAGEGSKRASKKRKIAVESQEDAEVREVREAAMILVQMSRSPVDFMNITNDAGRYAVGSTSTTAPKLPAHVERRMKALEERVIVEREAKVAFAAQMAREGLVQGPYGEVSANRKDVEMGNNA